MVKKAVVDMDGLLFAVARKRKEVKRWVTGEELTSACALPRWEVKRAEEAQRGRNEKGVEQQCTVQRRGRFSQELTASIAL